MSNLQDTIIAKSDQLNADDLITGPRTIEITAVDVKAGEQPVTIHYRGENGHPYKPSKTMRRIFIALWGSEGSAYVGKQVTIYRDPEIKFGGMAVGGIVISHASHITEPLQIALAVTKGKKKIYIVEPLAINTQKQLASLPVDWPNWSNEERGENRASLGIEALSVWWNTLTPAEKKPLEEKKDKDWKPMAAKKGAS